MKTFEKVITIKVLERLNNSYYGNPRYKVYFVIDGEDDYKIGKTASNAMIGYELGYSSEGKAFKVQYHYTKNDNLILDRIID